jgi:hypothetical protein
MLILHIRPPFHLKQREKEAPNKNSLLSPGNLYSGLLISRYKEGNVFNSPFGIGVLVEKEVVCGLVRLQLLPHCILCDGTMEAIEAAFINEHAHARLVIRCVVVPNKNILAECIVVNTRMPSIRSFRGIFIGHRKPGFPSSIEGINENNVFLYCLKLIGDFLMCHDWCSRHGKSCCISPFLWVLIASCFWVSVVIKASMLLRHVAMRCCSSKLGIGKIVIRAVTAVS